MKSVTIARVTAGVIGLLALGLAGCSSSPSRERGDRDLLGRTTLTPTAEEVERMRARDAKAGEDLHAIAQVEARYQAFEAAQAAKAAQQQEQVREYQEAEFLRQQAAHDAEVAKRRARISAIQQSVDPEYQRLRQEEDAYRSEVEDLKRLRGVSE